MLRVCIISDYDSLFIYKSVKGDAFAVHNKREAGEFLRKRLGGYNVIYITDTLYDVIRRDSMKYNEEFMPKVRPIPSARGKDKTWVDKVLEEIKNECFDDELEIKTA